MSVLPHITPGPPSYPTNTPTAIQNRLRLRIRQNLPRQRHRLWLISRPGILLKLRVELDYQEHHEPEDEREYCGLCGWCG